MAAAKENGRDRAAFPRAGGGGEDEAGDADHADARQDVRPGVGGKSEELEKRNENHESRMQRKQMQDQMVGIGYNHLVTIVRSLTREKGLQ